MPKSAAAAITGLVVGTDTVTPVLSGRSGRAGRNGLSDGFTTAACTGDGKKPYLNEHNYNDGAPAAVLRAQSMILCSPHSAACARDQHWRIPVEFRPDIEWTLADTNQTNATIENGKLLVAVGVVPDASYADVILEASSASAGKTAKNVVVRSSSSRPQDNPAPT